jgi:predicted DNA-binding transcriptional regulator AlpA
MIDTRRDDDDTFINGQRLRRVFGGVSHMWVRRRLAADPDFPKPRYVGSIPFWRLGDVRAWWESRPTTPPPASVEAGERGTEIAKARRKEKAEAGPFVAPAARRPRPPQRAREAEPAE